MVEIARFLPSALIDYPGNLACMVFLNKCNYRCPGCHSYDVVNGKANIQEQDIVRFIEGRKGWIDGIVISGGEPTLHADLPRLLGEFKRRGLAVKLDTNGSNPRILQDLIEAGLVNDVALDIKSDSGNYDLVTGVSGYSGKVEESMKLLADARKLGRINYETRTTVWPIINGGLRYMTKKEAEDMARWIADSTQDSHEHYLQRFEAPIISSCFDRRFALESLPEEFRKTPGGVLNALRDAMKPILNNVKIRGQE